MRKNVKKRKSALFFLKLAILPTAIYFSAAMPVLTGAGLIYNRVSYGNGLFTAGVLFIAAAAAMSAGAVLCLFRKNAADIISIILTSSGFVMCMAMLHKLTEHADKSGWTDKFDMTPVSGMYERRILPCILPVMLIILTDIVQLLTNEQSGKSRNETEAL